MGKDPTTFVASDHGFAPQFLAIDASQPLVELGLLSRPQTSNCRPATGETIGKAKACWAGGALQIYLNVAGRDPAGGGFTAGRSGRRGRDRRGDQGEVPRPGRPERLDARRPARGLEDDRPRLHQGGGPLHPERPGQHRRHGPSDPDRRPRRRSPIRRTSSTPRRRARWSRPSHFFGQHGYVPDVQDLAANINMRATFLAGGEGHRQGPGRRPARSTSPRRSRSCSASPSRSTARARCCSTWSRAGTGTSRSRSSG